jgi:hypothetical protein
MKNSTKPVKIIAGGISKLDKDLPFADQSNTCGRCVEKLGDDFKTYKKDIHRCKACSILVDHWLNTEYKDKAFSL